MKNLFYCPATMQAFWIAGYTDNTDSAFLLIEMVEKYANIFKRAILSANSEIGFKDIYTRIITKSQRYKNMRVFWANCDTQPKDSFLIEEDWTMDKWLEN